MKKKCFGNKYIMPNFGHLFLRNSNNTFLEVFQFGLERTMPFVFVPLRSGFAQLRSVWLPLGSEDIDKESHYALEETLKQTLLGCTLCVLGLKAD